MKDPNFFNDCYEWINETVRETKQLKQLNNITYSYKLQIIK